MRGQEYLPIPVPTAGLMLDLPPQEVPAGAALDGENVFVDVDGLLKPRPGFRNIAALGDATGANTLTGRVTISEAATTATVNLPVTQASATYPVIVWVSLTVGSPPALLVVYKTQTTTSFVVELSAAPGVGNSVIVSWLIPDPATVQGTVDFTGATVTQTVTFAVAEVDAAYEILHGVGLKAGTPPAVLASYSARITTGFDLNISAAAGAGNTLVVSYALVRVAGDTVGIKTFVSGDTVESVVFSVAEADTAYELLAGIRPNLGSPPFAGVVFKAKTTTGFDIEISGAPGAGEELVVVWRNARQVLGTVSEAILGGISFKTQTEALEMVIGTPTRWYRLDKAIPGWVDISDPALLNSGSVNDQCRFVAFPQTNKVWAIGVNNTDAMRRWEPGTAKYVTIAAAPIARDICVILSRLLVVNTIEGSIRFPYRTRWSSVNDATSWPALATNDLADRAEPLVACRRYNRSSAAIYGEVGLTLASAQPGGDSTAFRFEEVSPSVVGPLGPGVVIEALGAHWYLGRDGRAHMFDGVRVEPISQRIDALVQNELDFNLASRSHGVYYPVKRQLRWFYPLVGGSFPRRAIVYDLQTGRFEPPEKFNEDITTSFQADEQIGLTWETWVSATDTWETIPFGSWDEIPDTRQLILALGTQTGKVHRFGFSSSDDGGEIDYSFRSSLVRTSPHEKSLPDHLDMFFQRSEVPEGVTVTLYSLAHPTAVPKPIQTIPVEVSDDDTFDFKFPGSNRIDGAFLQLLVSGKTTKRAVKFGGAELFVNPERRA